MFPVFQSKNNLYTEVRTTFCKLISKYMLIHFNRPYFELNNKNFIHIRCELASHGYESTDIQSIDSFLSLIQTLNHCNIKKEGGQMERY